MDSEVRALVKSFRDGFTIEPVPNRLGRYYVLNRSGKRVMREDGPPLVLGKSSTPQSLSRIRHQLIQAGAIPAPRKTERDDAERKGHGTEAIAKVPFVLAMEVMNDPAATPRERAMAREVLRLRDQLDGAQAEIERVKGAAQVFYSRFETEAATA